MFGLDDGERKFSVLGLSNNHMGGKQNRQTKGGEESNKGLQI